MSFGTEFPLPFYGEFAQAVSRDVKGLTPRLLLAGLAGHSRPKRRPASATSWVLSDGPPSPSSRYCNSARGVVMPGSGLVRAVFSDAGGPGRDVRLGHRIVGPQPRVQEPPLLD